MTTPPTDSDSPDTISRSPHREAIQSEAGLRRVLAYICAQRHRRLIAFTAVFLLLFSVVKIPMSLFWYLYLVPDHLWCTGRIRRHSNPTTLFPARRCSYLVQTTLSLVLPLIVTLLIFGQLRKIYKGLHPDLNQPKRSVQLRPNYDGKVAIATGAEPSAATLVPVTLILKLLMNVRRLA